MKEVKDELNKWKDMLCSWVGRFNIVILPKMKFHQNPRKIFLCVLSCCLLTSQFCHGSWSSCWDAWGISFPIIFRSLLEVLGIVFREMGWKWMASEQGWRMGGVVVEKRCFLCVTWTLAKRISSKIKIAKSLFT